MPFADPIDGMIGISPFSFSNVCMSPRGPLEQKGRGAIPFLRERRGNNLQGAALP